MQKFERACVRGFDRLSYTYVNPVLKSDVNKGRGRNSREDFVVLSHAHDELIKSSVLVSELPKFVTLPRTAFLSSLDHDSYVRLVIRTALHLSVKIINDSTFPTLPPAYYYNLRETPPVTGVSVELRTRLNHGFVRRLVDRANQTSSRIHMPASLYLLMLRFF